MGMHVVAWSRNRTVVRAITRAFGPSGDHLTVCETGLAVLRAVETTAPHLVILDLETPGPGSLLLVAAIRKLAPGLPIVAVSTTPNAEAQALTQQGVAYTTVGPEGDGEAHPFLTRLARDQRGRSAAMGETP